MSASTTFAIHYQTPYIAHIYPVADWIEHTFDNGPRKCVCGPKVSMVEGEATYEHHSLDGREIDAIEEIDD